MLSAILKCVTYPWWECESISAPLRHNGFLELSLLPDSYQRRSQDHGNLRVVFMIMIAAYGSGLSQNNMNVLLPRPVRRIDRFKDRPARVRSKFHLFNRRSRHAIMGGE